MAESIDSAIFINNILHQAIEKLYFCSSNNISQI